MSVHVGGRRQPSSTSGSGALTLSGAGEARAAGVSRRASRVGCIRARLASRADNMIYHSRVGKLVKCE